jgi:hypothetical protein
MRTSINAIVTNRSVFGFGQDRAVATRNDESCACAAQHLSHWHAGDSDASMSRALKRRGMRVVAGAVLVARHLCLAITGPQGQPVRQTSPVLVMA